MKKRQLKLIKILFLMTFLIVFILFLLLLFNYSFIKAMQYSSGYINKVDIPKVFGYSFLNDSPLSITIKDVEIYYEGPGHLINSEPYIIEEPQELEFGTGYMDFLRKVVRMKKLKNIDVQSNTSLNFGIVYIPLSEGIYKIKKITVNYSVLGFNRLQSFENESIINVINPKTELQFQENP